MELWIRSQDRTTLMKVDRLDIDYSNGLYLIKSDGFVTLLANYKSEERALEVLDEIQNILKPIIKIKYEYDDSQPIMNGEWLKSLKEENKIEELSTYVYEMPKD